MIDKINGQKIYEYEKISKAQRKTVDSPEFHMDMDRQGVIYEKSDGKKKSAEAKAGRGSAEASGVKISSGAKKALPGREMEKDRQVREPAHLSEQFRKFAETAVSFLKKLWDRIWNEPDEEKQAEFPEILEERMAGTGEQTQTYLPGEVKAPERPVYTQDDIRAIFRRGNQKEIEDFLSENGKRHLVKNSDLLTQYDRTGMIVGVNRSDKELILHGNKNEIKL